MGGSARATVLAAEAARCVLEERFDALKLALVAHAEAQGGKGSGGDVAASFAGGMVRYRRYDVARAHRGVGRDGSARRWRRAPRWTCGGCRPPKRAPGVRLHGAERVDAGDDRAGGGPDG